MVYLYPGYYFSKQNKISYSYIPTSRLLLSIIIGRVTKTYELQTRENQTSFRSSRGCIDIFSISQVLEHRHAHRRPTMTFLDLKAAFNPVHREVLWQ